MFEQTVLNCVCFLQYQIPFYRKTIVVSQDRLRTNEIEKKNTQTKLTRNEWLLLLFSPQDEKEVAKGSRG